MQNLCRTIIITTNPEFKHLLLEHLRHNFQIITENFKFLLFTSGGTLNSNNVIVVVIFDYITSLLRRHQQR